MGIIRLPGLIDPHVHLRVPGGEYKEDFVTGTRAALAGGFTSLLAMPNTNPPLVSLQRLRIAQNLAREQSLCDVFLYAGAAEAYIPELAALAQEAIALKIYVNQTFGDLRLEGLSALMRVFEAWPAHKPICFHAEGESIAAALGLAQSYKRPVHICHVSRKDEIELIARAKRRGLQVSCEVTPHHLFLTEKDAARLGPLGDMRPLLQSEDDVQALWQAIGDGTVDCIGSDHAPHTYWEKLGFASSEACAIANAAGQGAEDILRVDIQEIDFNAAQASAAAGQKAHPPRLGPKPAPPGVPGLESTLPLMLSAVHDGQLTLERAIALMYTNPRRIFGLPEQPQTWVEVDTESSYSFPDHPLYTKAAWSPFAGRKVTGRVLKTVLRGRLLYQNGQITENKMES
ncbi:MAG: amidohydrolase family protein [Anaerolineaceae bacterium]|nr:amidohydrolase family protein [Anaerolineaceae bacterium]